MPFLFLRGRRVSFVYGSSFRFSVKKCSKSKGNKTKQIILNFLQLTLNTNEMLTNLLSLSLTRFSRPLSFSNLNFLKSKLILDILQISDIACFYPRFHTPEKIHLFKYFSSAKTKVKVNHCRYGLFSLYTFLPYYAILFEQLPQKNFYN